MLVRTLEPEIMEGNDEAEEYAAMNFAAPNARFAEDALALIANVENPVALDIGTGTAEIPLLMLSRHRSLRVVAVDLADAMLAIARRRATESGHQARIELRKLDGKALGLPHGSFDLVMSNSVVHHIPNPADLFLQVATAVRPNGAIIVRDLARPPSREAAAALVERYADGDTAKQRGLFFDSLCAALTIPEVREAATTAGLTDLRIVMVSDRHWTAERSASSVRRSP